MNESRIGPFSIEERLGGKQSSVCRAIHLEQRKQVVLKTFAVPFGVTEHAGSDFVTEMALLRQLQHANIVRCFGGKIEGSIGYTAWELIDGENLVALLARRGRLAWDQAIEHAQAIAAALHGARDLDLTHQDLMPDKLLITREGVLKVADFRRDRVNNPWCFSSRKKSLARWSYLAPEQLRGEAHITHKADLYSLGCVLYHMLTGRPPFVARTPEELRGQHLNEVPPRACSVALDCPIWLDALVAQMLEKDAAARPHSAEAVGLALAEAKKKAASGVSVTQHALGGFSALRMPVDKQEARKLVVGKRAREEHAHEGAPLWERPWFLAVALIGLLAVFGAALTYALRPMSEQQLIREADSLMASENPVDWRKAEESYIQPLLTRFPKSDYLPKAKEHLDTIAMHQAQQHAKTLQRLGRTPTHEGERLFVEAQRYEQFGDRVSALDKYQAMVNVLKAEGDDRPFVLLAKRRIAAITNDKSETADAREKFITEKLAEAEQLAAKGKKLDARKIWYGLESLYGQNAELAPLIDQARAKLKGSQPVADTPASDLEK
jgi:eukaryotic-like serine/threonine-protein kinase